MQNLIDISFIVSNRNEIIKKRNSLIAQVHQVTGALWLIDSIIENQKETENKEWDQLKTKPNLQKGENQDEV